MTSSLGWNLGWSCLPGHIGCHLIYRRDTCRVSPSFGSCSGALEDIHNTDLLLWIMSQSWLNPHCSASWKTNIQYHNWDISKNRSSIFYSQFQLHGLHLPWIIEKHSPCGWEIFRGDSSFRLTCPKSLYFQSLCSKRDVSITGSLWSSTSSELWYLRR